MRVILSLSAGFIVALAAFWPACAADDLSLKRLFSESRGGKFVQPSEADVAAAESLFARMLKGERGAEVAKAWTDLGFTLIRTTAEAGRTFFVVMESADKKTGRGFYAFSETSTLPVALFMPHRFADELTGVIGFDLMREGSFPVAAWNTVPRRSKTDRNTVQDLARLPNTYFTALTKAFAQTFPDGYHLQLHGFVPGKRKTPSGKEANAVISGGGPNPRNEIEGLALCLGKNGFGKIGVYPRDIRELGATTNISGKILRGMGNRGFVHVEMSHDLRSRLTKDEELRRAFVECVGQHLR